LPASPGDACCGLILEMDNPAQDDVIAINFLHTGSILCVIARNF
jgi:hypothetical protein